MSVLLFLMYWKEVSFISKKHGTEELVNENIRFKEVMWTTRWKTPMRPAYESNLDLLCVAPNAVPPVCKILDYGRYRFEQQKKAKEAKKKQHVTEVKPLRLSPVIDTHDFETKLRQARGWAEDGMKIKVDMRFRGRMITRQDVGKQVMNQFIEQMSDVAGIDKQPTMEGNTLSVVLTPKKK